MSSIKSTAQHQTPLLSPGNVDGMHTVQISERNSSNPPSSKGVILSVDRANITYPSDICDPFGDEFECISLESTSTCSSNSSNFKFSDNGSDATDDTSDDEETDVNKPFTLQHACVVYEVVGVIGCGGFGEVLQAESSLGDQVAIKVCSKATRGRSAESLSDMIMDERDVLLLTARKEQPFLTQPLACFQDDNNVYYVMRLYPKNLAEVIFSGTKFSPPQFKILAAELLLGLEGLHKLRVVHRDLKPDNILVTPNGHIAVADFGLARPFTRKLGPQSLMYEDVGTPGYFAPEFFHLPEGEGYTSAIDTWGFGVILYEAYTGKYIIHAPTEDELHRLNYELPWRLDAQIEASVQDQELAEVLRFVLASDPAYRPSWAELREFAFFADVDWDAVKSRSSPVEMPKPTMMRPRPYRPVAVEGDKIEILDRELDFDLGDDLRRDEQHGQAVMC